jgi:hypothetical protein
MLMAQLGEKPFTHLTWKCTSHKILPHTIFIYTSRVSDLPFPPSPPPPVCFRALKTLGTETPANPDISFLIYCTNNQEYFSKYMLRALKMIPLVSTLTDLVLFMFPFLLLATLRLPLCIGLQVHIIPICERVKY